MGIEPLLAGIFWLASGTGNSRCADTRVVWNVLVHNSFDCTVFVIILRVFLHGVEDQLMDHLV